MLKRGLAGTAILTYYGGQNNFNFEKYSWQRNVQSTLTNWVCKLQCPSLHSRSLISLTPKKCPRKTHDKMLIHLSDQATSVFTLNFLMKVFKAQAPRVTWLWNAGGSILWYTLPFRTAICVMLEEMTLTMTTRTNWWSAIFSFRWILIVVKCCNMSYIFFDWRLYLKCVKYETNTASLGNIF